MDNAPRLKDAEFRQIADMVYQRYGIHLNSQKRTLVEGRLAKRLRDLGLPSYGDYVSLLSLDASGTELTEFVNRITTNHSFFYREHSHFDFLVKIILPEILRRQDRNLSYPLRIWSAGCSSGDEVYTVAMLIREFYGSRFASIDCGLLATDISEAALREAQSGIYSGSRLKELPHRFLSTWFTKIGADQFLISPEIRKMVLFKRFNLMSEHFPFKGQFDLVLCRNVMIYFDQPTRDSLVDNIYQFVKPGGYFFIGHSESLPRTTCPFRYVSPAIYQKGSA